MNEYQYLYDVWTWIETFLFNYLWQWFVDLSIGLYHLYLIPPDPVLVVWRKAGERVWWAVMFWDEGDTVKGTEGTGQPAAEHSHWSKSAKLSDWSACIWLQVICPQQSDMYIYREQLVRAICSIFSLPFHNWKFFWFVFLLTESCSNCIMYKGNMGWNHIYNFVPELI